MPICISGGQIDYLRRLNLRSVSRWGGWRAGQWRSRLWSRLSASVGWRCTCSFASPECLRILCSAILAWKAAGRLVLTKHCRVSLYRSLHLFVPRKLNTLLLLFSDLGSWFLNEIFRFLDCGTRKAFLGTHTSDNTPHHLLVLPRPLSSNQFYYRQKTFASVFSCFLRIQLPRSQNESLRSQKDFHFPKGKGKDG